MFYARFVRLLYAFTLRRSLCEKATDLRNFTQRLIQ